MSITFPTNPEDFIKAIEQDAPAVYEYLMDEWKLTPRLHTYPSREDLTTILENYSGNNYDTHWWNWLWSIMKELINSDAYKGDNGTLHVAELMNDLTRIHYGYHLIRCESCDQPHRMYQEGEVLKPGSQLTRCSCWQELHEDHPDLFY